MDMRRASNAVSDDPEPYLRAEAALFRRLDSKLMTDDVLPCMHSDPLIVGQVMHEVIDGLCVYLVVCQERASDSIHVKIGIAKNIVSRLKSAFTDNPLDIKEVHYFCIGPAKVARKIERDLHQIFSRENRKGEWFFLPDEEHLERLVFDIDVFMREKLGWYFNHFLYRPGKTTPKEYRAIKNYVGYAWHLLQAELYSESGPTEEYEGGGYAALSWDEHGARDG